MLINNPVYNTILFNSTMEILSTFYKELIVFKKSSLSHHHLFLTLSLSACAAAVLREPDTSCLIS